VTRARLARHERESYSTHSQAFQTYASIMRAIQAGVSNHRQYPPAQCTGSVIHRHRHRQCFKRTIQTQVICKCKFVALGGEGVGNFSASEYLSVPPPFEKMCKWRTCLTRVVNLVRVVHEQSSFI
jgi:hypothetical protein